MVYDLKLQPATGLCTVTQSNYFLNVVAARSLFVRVYNLIASPDKIRTLLLLQFIFNFCVILTYNTQFSNGGRFCLSGVISGAQAFWCTLLTHTFWSAGKAVSFVVHIVFFLSLEYIYFYLYNYGIFILAQLQIELFHFCSGQLCEKQCSTCR